MDDLENYVFAAIDRYFAGRYTKRYGLVTSWDPKTHLAKVKIQPEGQETGWIPTQAMSAGNGYGHMSGLSVGDQVEVTYQEGEFEAGAITSRVHSEVDPPPQVESGEELIKAKFGQVFKQAKDGSFTCQNGDASGKIFCDGSGHITITCVTLTINASGKVAINGTPVDLNG